jgi:hypothetical protein
MKRFVFLGLAVFLVVALWSGAWVWAAGEIRKGAALLAEADGVTTPRVTCASLDVAGFPFRFAVTCADAEIISGDLVTNVAGIEAQVLVYRPTHVLASVKAPATLADAFTGSSSRIDFSGMQLSASLEGWRIGRVSLTADDLSWTDTLYGDLLLARSTHFEAHLLDIPEQHQPETQSAALAGYAKADRVTAPGLAIEDGDLSFEAELSEVPDDVRNFADPLAVMRWRERGGELNIFAIKGTDGDSFIEGTGRLAIDTSAQLQGELNISSKGVAETIAPLFAPGIAPLILGSPDAEGTYSQKLTIDQGIVYSGMLAVGQLPPLM